MRLLREELQLLQEQGSYVGEVVRAMDKKKVLVKVSNTFSIRQLSARHLILFTFFIKKGGGVGILFFKMIIIIYFYLFCLLGSS